MIISNHYHNWSNTLAISGRLLEEGKSAAYEDKWLCFCSLTGSMVLLVAALESFLNSLGSISYEGDLYDKFERKPPLEKLILLCKELSIDLELSRRPAQTAKAAIRWRNLILHSKPRITVGVDIGDNDALAQSYTNNEYERQVDLETAERFYKDISELIKNLRQKAKS